MRLRIIDFNLAEDEQTGEHYHWDGEEWKPLTKLEFPNHRQAAQRAHNMFGINIEQSYHEMMNEILGKTTPYKGHRFTNP